MNKILTALMLAISFAVSAPVAAQQLDCTAIDISRYSQDELNKLRSVCNNGSPIAQADKISPDEVKEWASLGKEFGLAIGEVAKSLGVAVNDFLRTPAGALIALYLLWDVLGGILFGVPLLFLVWVLYFVFLRFVRPTETEYEHVPYLWGAISIKRIVKQDKPELDPSYTVFAGLVAIAFSIPLLIAIF